MPTGGGNTVPAVSDDECHILSRGKIDDSADGGASDNENS
jgi:hypothetical protein